MSRSALFILACALLVSITFTFASPAPIVNGELETRTTHTGRGTWYYPGLGNCGYTNTEADLILAISIGLYNDNDGSNCDQWVSITYNGVQAYGKTVDSCQSCGDNDIDMSPALFQKFATLGTGEITVTWNFMSRSWAP